jgi:hypothetical protein
MGAAVGLLALSACATRTPIVVSLAKLPPMQGTAVTTVYTGALEAAGCQGSYTGALGATEVPLELSCRDGRHGIGTAILQGSAFVAGRVRLNDGSVASIAPGRLGLSETGF